MSTRLANVLESLSQEERGLVDVTRTMEMLYTNSDRVVLDADLMVCDVDEPAHFSMRFGLRSEILSDFPRYAVVAPNPFVPCDIPSLVPLIAIEASSRRLKGLRGVEIEQAGESNQVTLTFIGEPDVGKSNLSQLASAVNRVMDRWKGWTSVLLSILDRDPVMGPEMSGVDWREFLAGESGFITMPWFRPMTYSERARALESVVTTSRALLASFLSLGEMRRNIVVELLNWLEHLEPQLHVTTGRVEETVEVA
ncbi:MAG: hypothetical protein DRP09_00760 [Candidatus Thorarchaeota archaeon]|nr:MAG: hypothetical protein DRP09_00760 [Candidatus Thorarchaeota archaeon]